jgi:hypothetical protein
MDDPSFFFFLVTAELMFRAKEYAFPDGIIDFSLMTFTAPVRGIYALKARVQGKTDWNLRKSFCANLYVAGPNTPNPVRTCNEGFAFSGTMTYADNGPTLCVDGIVRMKKGGTAYVTIRAKASLTKDDNIAIFEGYLIPGSDVLPIE